MQDDRQSLIKKYPPSLQLGTAFCNFHSIFLTRSSTKMSPPGESGCGMNELDSLKSQSCFSYRCSRPFCKPLAIKNARITCKGWYSIISSSSLLPQPNQLKYDSIPPNGKCFKAFSSRFEIKEGTYFQLMNTNNMKPCIVCPNLRIATKPVW